MKRLTALLLCAVMALFCVPALAENGHGPLWIEGGEGVTLTYWIPIDATNAQYYETLAEHPFYKWMEEQTGVHVEFIHPSIEQQEQQFNLMVASGNYYDMLFADIDYYYGTQAAVDDGIIADINRYRDLMPDYFEAIACDDGSFAAWEWGPEKELYYAGIQPSFEELLPTAAGQMWCVSQVWTDALPCECGAIIRKDWLDDAGLQVPTTLAELETVLAAFKARGEDVIPMTYGATGYNDSGAIETAFGFYGSWFTMKDGVVDPVACTTPAFKDYLTLLNSWYEKGYIDPDFMNRDSDSQQAMFLSDKLGIILRQWSAPGYYEDLYEGADPDFNVVAMSNPRMTEDQILGWRHDYSSSPIVYTVITEKCEHKEIAAQWLNTMFKKETILRASYGVEGESYTLENGAPYYTDWFYENDPSLLYNIYLRPNTTGYYSTRASVLKSADPATYRAQRSDYMEASFVWADHCEPTMNIGYIVFSGDDWSHMYDQYMEAGTYADAMVLKYITGVEPLDTFDSFAQKALDMGYAGAVVDVQKAINAMRKR